MKGLTDNLEPIADRIRDELTAKDVAREKVLPRCREAIRHCSQAIRAVHRQEFDKAQELLKGARQLLGEAENAGSAYNELGYAGFVRDAQKEFAEGSIILALVMGKPMPAPDELGVDVVSYLKGMGEAVGELRRYLLDSMRRGDLSNGEELLAAMDDIYNTLVTMDFPDAITSGLRHTTDMVRGVLEKTRSDLTLAMGQKGVVDKLDELSTEK
ncbi:MAG: haloacid dehalogenase [Dehalococcoidales bacterium]|jgi:translin|nr:haloacid dehalogenase [Dehalococcoidales bacterium]